MLQTCGALKEQAVSGGLYIALARPGLTSGGTVGWQSLSWLAEKWALIIGFQTWVKSWAVGYWDKDEVEICFWNRIHKKCYQLEVENEGQGGIDDSRRFVDFYPREMVVSPALTKEKESVGVNAGDGWLVCSILVNMHTGACVVFRWVCTVNN